jgi:hypothetical protein
MFEINPSFENTIFWEDSLDKNESDGNLKFPVTFHYEIPRIDEIEDQLTLPQPKKKDKVIKVVEISKKSRSKDKKNNLF